MLAAPFVAGCTTSEQPPPPPDPLAALAARARSDAAMADAIAAAAPNLAAVAGEVSRVRGEHAVALQKEVDRARPPVSSSAPSTATPPAVDPATAKATLVDGLTGAEKQAGDLIATLPRYRAGLVGSVAAGCASLREVIG